jgi:hypothetical protein
VAHAQGTLGGLADDREGLDQEVFEGLAIFDPRLELGGLAAQLVVGELFHLRFEGIDGLDLGLEALHLAVVGGAEDRLGEIGENHEEVLILGRCAAGRETGSQLRAKVAGNGRFWRP